jgi:hypothetical protein
VVEKLDKKKKLGKMKRNYGSVKMRLNLGKSKKV